MSNYISDQDLKGQDYAGAALTKTEYDSCTFTDSNFAGADLSGSVFTECRFINCDLSMAKLRGTSFRECSFKSCKMLGMHFSNCDPFLLSFNFENCLLGFASFHKLKLKNTRFEGCKLEETDLVEADLSNAAFINCDLGGAVFENTVLEGADLRTAYNFSIDPSANRISGARFSMQNLSGLLHQYRISIE